MNTYSQVHQAIEGIITKGGEALYEAYLNQKLPDDCNQIVMNRIHGKFNQMLYEEPIKNTIRKERMPQPASADKNIPHKVVIRSRSQLNMRNKADNNFFNTQLPVPKQRNHARENIKSARPNCCIKYSCYKGEVDHQSDKKRKQKIQSEIELIKSARQTEISEQQKPNHRANIQRKIKQLLQQGIPYTYDNDGNLQIPNIKQFKKGLQNKYPSQKNKNTFTLRVKALQLLTRDTHINTKEQSAKTRKKGFYSMKNDSPIKKKVNEQEFNNKNERQYSNIPFMNVEDGVKIIERQKNIMAHKIRQSKDKKTRNQFLAASRNTTFRSFLPSQYSSVRASSAQRPMTSFTHKKSGISFGTVSASNLKHRPKTSRQRITIYSKIQTVNLIKN